MADEKIELSVAEMARTMGNAVLRERRRCAALLAEYNTQKLKETGDMIRYTSLDELRETMLMPPTAQVVPTASLPTVGEAAPVEAEVVDDGLPPHRDRDDMDEGIALVHSRTSFGRRAGGIID